jgi:hypothetical protein
LYIEQGMDLIPPKHTQIGAFNQDSIGLPKKRFSISMGARHHEVKRFGTKDLTKRILFSQPIL